MKRQYLTLLKYLSYVAYGLSLFFGFEALINSKNSFKVVDLSVESSDQKLHEGFDQSQDKSPFSSPFELLDAWRRATAMEDATSPADALDEAIKAFEDKELVNSIND